VSIHGRTAFVAAFIATAAQATAQARPPAAAAPAPRDCSLQFRSVIVNGQPTTTYARFTIGLDRTNDFIGGGVDAFCANTDQRITADSAEQLGNDRLVYLIGRVRYTEKRMALSADRMTYYMGEERLVAEGNVVGRTSTGTHFRGPHATYLRPKAGLRDRSRLDAGGRPDAWISAQDAGTDSTKRDSTHVLADSLISDNDSLIYARGRVVIDRPDLSATADSAMLDQGRELAALRKTPAVRGKGESPFTLAGAEIDIFSRQRSAERVRSAGNANAVSDEVALTADTIDLRISARKLSRAIAWGPKRAVATQKDREITADSIDVQMPGQVLRAMHAVRRARAESLPDSTKVKSKERDWFAGDTIDAEFNAVAPGDTAKSSIRLLTARGSAKSWQQAARENAPVPDSMPAINYMTGRVISVEFGDDRQLARVRVTDQVSGVLVQPTTDSVKTVAKPTRPPGGSR
jgi:lipopolysaccharide export system protein LptA